MSKNHMIVVVVIAIVGAFGAQKLLADDIKPEHRVCVKDADCTLIDVGCVGCGVHGTRQAINTRYTKEYEKLGQCTKKEILIRARTDCAYVQHPVAICVEHKCTTKMVDGER